MENFSNGRQFPERSILITKQWKTMENDRKMKEWKTCEWETISRMFYFDNQIMENNGK